MNEEQTETQQLDTGWKIILVIWGAILASLGMYLVVCLFIIGKELKIDIDPNLPLEKIKYALFGASFITLFAVHYLRKFLLKDKKPSQTPSPQHPAVARYTVIVVITSAILESIGIYGIILFLLAKDTLSLYQLLIISAVAMIHFRPRKDELSKLAFQMKTQLEY